MDGEGASHSGRTLDTDGATVGVGHPFGDGESETASSNRAGPSLINSVERKKDFLKRNLWYPDSCIFDDHLCRSIDCA